MAPRRSGGVHAVAYSLLLLLLVSSGFSPLREASALNAITSIPGFDGPLPFNLETGYVEVDESRGVQLFYYFIESERKPEEDPLLVWITGGPGCSAFSGLVFEIGPLKFDVAGYTEGFPTLLYFPDSWTKVSSVIFLDAPVGTGFSYAKTEEGLETSDSRGAAHILTFLRKWLLDHPKFITNPLYLGGDSYSGYTVPISAKEIVRGNKDGDALTLNLKGYLVGNPGTDLHYDNGARVPFLHGMGLISDEMYQEAKRSCNGDYVTPSNAQCANALQVIDKCVFGINPVHVLEPICGFAKRRDTIFAGDRRRLVQDNVEDPSFLALKLPVECRDNGYRLSYIWADDPEVRRTLGIHEGSIGAWSRCSQLKFTHDIHSAIAYHRDLTTGGYRALVYNGDHDMDMPFIGTLGWIKSLNFSVVDEWRPWNVNGQVAGFTRSYRNNLTYATVKGAGHTAPEYKPKECLAMVDRWFSGQPL